MQNKAILIGHAGRGAEVKTTAAGKLASFSLATTERWRDKATGDRRERTQWHQVVIFDGALAEIAGQYVRKGSKLYLEGAIETREYTDRGGAPRRVTEIVLRPYRGQLVLLDRAEGAGRADDDAPPAAEPPPPDLDDWVP